MFKKNINRMSSSTKKVYHLVNVLDENGKVIEYDSTSEYHNSVPSGAARKAFSAVCRHKQLKGECGMTVNVKQKNKDKEYSYSVYRSKLETPKELLGRTIEYEVYCKSNKKTPGKSTETETTTATVTATVKKAPAKKASAKKASAKKESTKKVPVKKESTKKVPAKKAPAKKAPAKKAPTKK